MERKNYANFILFWREEEKKINKIVSYFYFFLTRENNLCNCVWLSTTVESRWVYFEELEIFSFSLSHGFNIKMKTKILKVNSPQGLSCHFSYYILKILYVTFVPFISRGAYPNDTNAPWFQPTAIQAQNRLYRYFFKS